MITLPDMETARRERHSLTISAGHRYDTTGYETVTERFWDGDDQFKDHVRGVMVRLLLDGNDDERGFAAGFLANNHPPDAYTVPLVAAYLETPTDQPLRTVLGRWLMPLTPDDAEALKVLFLADPSGQIDLLANLLEHFPGATLWQAVAEAITEIDDIDVLARAMDATACNDQLKSFIPLLADKPSALKKQLASRVPIEYAEPLLRFYRMD